MNPSSKADNTDSRKTGRWHTIYSIISTLIEMAGIAALLLWILPLFNIVLPEWAVVGILGGFLVISYVSYRIGHPTVLYRKTGAVDEMVGMTGVAESDFETEGFVRVHGELWKAESLSGKLNKGQDVVVDSIAGLKLRVKRKEA